MNSSCDRSAIGSAMWRSVPFFASNPECDSSVRLIARLSGDAICEFDGESVPIVRHVLQLTEDFQRDPSGRDRSVVRE